MKRPSVADRSPTGRRFLGIVVAEQSPIDLQPKNAVFDRTVVALVAPVFSRKEVADRLQYMCDRVLNQWIVIWIIMYFVISYLSYHK